MKNEPLAAAGGYFFARISRLQARTKGFAIALWKPSRPPFVVEHFRNKTHKKIPPPFRDGTGSTIWIALHPAGGLPQAASPPAPSKREPLFASRVAAHPPCAVTPSRRSTGLACPRSGTKSLTSRKQQLQRRRCGRRPRSQPQRCRPGGWRRGCRRSLRQQRTGRGSRCPRC